MDNIEFQYKKGIEKDIEKDKEREIMSILAIGDPHFKIDNMDLVSIYISRIKDILMEKHPTFTIVLGDLLHCHERVHTTVLNMAYSFIDTLRAYAPVYILVGNHDYINNSQFLSDKHWMNALKEWNNVCVVDKGLVIDAYIGKYILCPYVFPGRLKEALDLIDTDWVNAKAIFCHQEFFGCKMGAITSTDGDQWDVGYPFVISGHIHDKQKVQDNIFYTGSSIQHAFGETHDKTISLCHFDVDRLNIENIDLRLPSKRIMYMDIDKITSFDPPISDDTLRITLSGTYEEFKVFKKSKKYKELSNQNIKIVYRHTLNDITAPNTNEDFYDILYGFVIESKDSDIMHLYNSIVKTSF